VQPLDKGGMGLVAVLRFGLTFLDFAALFALCHRLLLK
jgi:hypothetical protein